MRAPLFDSLEAWSIGAWPPVGPVLPPELGICTTSQSSSQLAGAGWSQAEGDASRAGVVSPLAGLGRCAGRDSARCTGRESAR